MTAFSPTESARAKPTLDPAESPYSFEYLHDLRRHHFTGALRFALAMPLAMNQSGAPRDAFAVARLVTAVHEDCGPCAQIVVDDALRRGVSPRLLRDVLDRRIDRLSREQAAVFRLADATVRADPAAADLGTEVEGLLGRKALAALALAIASVRLFPTIKRVLGYARSCSQVRIEIPDEEDEREEDAST